MWWSGRWSIAIRGPIRAIGVDEIQYAYGHKYLTLVYQIENDCTRPLWIVPPPARAMLPPATLTAHLREVIEERAGIALTG
jgi:hypothetical protein